MNASVMRMNANAAATRSVACALPARRTAQRGKTQQQQPKQHEQSNSLALCRLRTRTLGDTRRETREGAGTGGDDRGVDMPMIVGPDERARERAPDSRERREGARSTAPVVRPSRNAAPPTPPDRRTAPPPPPRRSKAKQASLRSSL